MTWNSDSLTAAGLPRDCRRLAQTACGGKPVFAPVRQLGASPTWDASKLSWGVPRPQLALKPGAMTAAGLPQTVYSSRKDS
jgi:hypothetical protein